MVHWPTIPSPPILEPLKTSTNCEKVLQVPRSFPLNPYIVVCLLTFGVLLSFHNCFVLIR